MSSSNCVPVQFPFENLSLNLDTIHLIFFILGLVKVVFLSIIFLDRKSWVFNFLLGLSIKSQLDHDAKSNPKIEFEPYAEKSSSEENMVLDQQQILIKGDLELVLKSLGLFSGDVRESDHHVKLDHYGDLYNVFDKGKNIPSLDEVKEAFDVFDSNRDGFIDANELHKVLCALGLKEGFEVENCRSMVRAFDEDGDGRIDFDEFVKLMENNCSI